MRARRFGSGPDVPVIGIGTWNMEHDDRRAAIAAIRRALDHLGERAIEHRVVPWCERHGVAVVAYSPLGSRDGFPDSRALDPTGGSAPRLAALEGVARRLGATPRQVALAFPIALDAAAIAAIEAAFPLRPWRGLPTL